MRMVALSECCEIVSGATPKRAVAEYWGGTVNWFTPKDLSNLDGKEVGSSPEQISEAGLNSCSATLIPPGSLLFSSRAPIGHLAITTEWSSTNQGFKSLIPGDDVDVRYLYYALLHNRQRLQDLGTGATFKELNKKRISKFKIPLPPLPEQRRLADRLDAADRLRALDAALVAKYDEVKRSLFLEMFGDLRVRTTRFPLAPLTGFVTKIGDGLHGTPSYDNHGAYFFINGTNLENGSINIRKTTKRINFGEFQRIRKNLDDSTVLVSINGTLGKVALYRNENVALGKSACYINVDHRKLRREFLQSVIESDYFKFYAHGGATGSTIKNMSLKSVRSLPVPDVSLDIQDYFVDRLTVVHRLHSLARTAQVQGDKMFFGLLGEHFSVRATKP